MDLTKIDKPFGELDDATKGALLLAHLRGEVIERRDNGVWGAALLSDGPSNHRIYRVQPKPVIGEVVMSGVGPIYHSLHPDMGVKNYSYEISVTFPTRDGQHVPGVYTSPDGLQIKIEVAG